MTDPWMEDDIAYLTQSFVEDERSAADTVDELERMIARRLRGNTLIYWNRVHIRAPRLLPGYSEWR